MTIDRWNIFSRCKKTPTTDKIPTKESDTVKIPTKNVWRTFLSFIGPGFMIAVGYVDPGNWATDLAAGSEFGYQLLFVILFSNVMAVLLQYLCVKLGVVTRSDLAQSCRKHFHPVINFILYILAEMAIIATDLAEVIGTAIALNLLFGLPIVWGVLLTGLDVLIILLFFKARYLRVFEMGLMLFVITIGCCFVVLLTRTLPDWGEVFAGYLPIVTVFKDPGALYLAMGIIGATVMPHNLYLHSHLVKYRAGRKEPLGEIDKKVDHEDDGEKTVCNPDQAAAFRETQQTLSLEDGELMEEVAPVLGQEEKVNEKHIRNIIRFSCADSTMALSFALLINSSILIESASAFETRGLLVSDIPEAYRLLRDLIGQYAATVFAVGLFLSGQSSTITGTLAGQVVMSGFLGPRFKIPPWARRLITRCIAIVPALVVAASQGEAGVSRLLVLSQVILSLQLPFAVWPLIYFTTRKSIMRLRCVQSHREEEASLNSGREGDERVTVESEKEVIFSNGWVLTVTVFVIALLITGLNLFLLTQVSTAFNSE